VTAVLLLVAAGVALVTGYDNTSVEYLLGCAVVAALLRRRDTP
jgi:hypothetical protein